MTSNVSNVLSNGSPCFRVDNRIETPMEVREKLCKALEEQDLDEAQILENPIFSDPVY